MLDVRGSARRRGAGGRVRGGCVQLRGGACDMNRTGRVSATPGKEMRRRLQGAPTSVPTGLRVVGGTSWVSADVTSVEPQKGGV